jgi:hypothetical protein
MAKSRSKENPGSLYQEFLELLGEYVVWSASTETNFLAFLQIGIRNAKFASGTIWLQFNSTRARLDMTLNYYRAEWPKSEVTAELAEFVSRYRGLTRQRNFFCHANYAMIGEGWWQAIGYQVTANEDVLQATHKRIDRATCNEIKQAIANLNSLYDDMCISLRKHQDNLIASGALSTPLKDIPQPRRAN